MARLSGLEKNMVFPDDKTADMRVMLASTVQDIYKEFKIGLEVNDGRFLKAVDDREEEKHDSI